MLQIADRKEVVELLEVQMQQLMSSHGTVPCSTARESSMDVAPRY